MAKVIDLTNQDFGYWHVIERAGSSTSGRARWKCLCTACGEIKDVDGAHLRGGRTTNCGCVRAQKLRKATMKDEKDKEYGKLKVIREALEEEKPRHDKNGVYWVCECDCGNIVVVFGDYLRNKDTSSCGCSLSKNESVISKLLQEANIVFKTQYIFKDLTGKNGTTPLRFDFAIFKNGELSYLIEYDGVQHFKPSKYASSWNTEENLLITKENDKKKNEYCQQHNIPLIRIKYDQNYCLNDLILKD